MQCPQCGTRNPLGTSQCSRCAKPFTRAASHRQDEGRRSAQARASAAYPSVAQSAYHSPPPTHTNRHRPRARRGRAGGCLLTLFVMLTVAAGIAVVGVVATNLYVKPRVAEAVSTNIGKSIEETLRDRVNAELADLPAGEVTISQADINQRIAAQGDLGPVDDMRVTITENGITAGLSAYGLNGSYTANLAVVDGEIRLSNGSIGGPLQYLVEQSEIEQITSDTINQALADAGYRVESVTLEDGSLILNLEQQGS